MMTKMAAFDDEVSQGFDVKNKAYARRVRRDIDAPLSPIPTPDPSIAEQPNRNRMMGPYSWPIYSGISTT